MSRLYIGNLPFEVQESDVKTLFLAYDTSAHVTLLTDQETGRGRGFGFVEIKDQCCDEAIANLNGMAVNGRRIRVEAAKTPGVRYTEDKGDTPNRPQIKHRRKGIARVRNTSRKRLLVSNKTERTIAMRNS